MQIFKIDGSHLYDSIQFHKFIQAYQEVEKAPSLVMVTGDPSMKAIICKIAQQSIEPDYDFTASLAEVEAALLDLARSILPLHSQSRTLSFIRRQFNQVEDLCKGIQLLGIMPAQTLQRIETYPSLLLTQLFSDACYHHGIDVTPYHAADASIVIPVANKQAATIS